MPYVLSTALVLILGGSRQAHIRLGDLCTPPQSPLPIATVPPLGGWISHRGARAFGWKRDCSFFRRIWRGEAPCPRLTETLLSQIIFCCRCGRRVRILSTYRGRLTKYKGPYQCFCILFFGHFPSEAYLSF